MKTKMAVLLLSVALLGRASAADLVVQAAASLSDALGDAGAIYGAKSGDDFRFNFAASSTLARQIEEGAPADLFVSADEAKMNDLEAKGLLVPGTRRALLSNTLVLIVPADAQRVPKAVADLAQGDYKKIALAEPNSVPAGIYAREYLEHARVWESLKAKMVPLENVRAALAAVESGDAEAGFVYKTDAMTSKKVKVALEITGADAPKISYPLAVLKSSKEPERARRFAEYLAGPEAAEIFRKFGFTLAK